MVIDWRNHGDGYSLFVDGKASHTGYVRIRHAGGIEASVYERGAEVARIPGSDMQARDFILNRLGIEVGDKGR